jgi:hypothetical protein
MFPRSPEGERGFVFVHQAFAIPDMRYAVLMSGVSYVLNDKGDKTAVLIDLKSHGRLWEDFRDGLVAQSRRSESRVTLASVRRRMELKRRKVNA